MVFLWLSCLILLGMATKCVENIVLFCFFSCKQEPRVCCRWLENYWEERAEAGSFLGAAVSSVFSLNDPVGYETLELFLVVLSSNFFTVIYLFIYLLQPQLPMILKLHELRVFVLYIKI